MPSSMCWPFRLSDHFCIETTFSERNTSSLSARSKMPRWFTQPPRLVETVTSGEVVTMRSASALSPLPSSFRMRPKASCVDMRWPGRKGSASGSGTGGAECRPGLRLKGAAAMNASRVSSPTSRPAKRDHSAPSSTCMAARKSAICSSVMMPA